MILTKGRTAFITGAAGGVGLELARTFSAAGLKVAMADLDRDRVEAAAAQVTAEGGLALPLRLDVRDADGWAEAAEQAWAWGGGVQVLCNNAGVVFVGSVLDQDPALWRLTQEVNVQGAYLGVRALLPRMLASGEAGRIVNTASLAALWGQAKLAAYSASKFALLGFSEALSLELARTPIGVTVVFPGPIRTGMGAASRRAGRLVGVTAPDLEASSTPPDGMDPAALAQRVVQGVRADETYVMTHGGWAPVVQVRGEALLAAFGESADPAYRDDPGGVRKLADRLAAHLSGNSGEARGVA